MSSCTNARGCPNTTDAARHTCLIRGPPARRNSWHSGEMSCGCTQQDFKHLTSQQMTTCRCHGLFFSAYMYLWWLHLDWKISVELGFLFPPLPFRHVSRPGASRAREQLKKRGGERVKDSGKTPVSCHSSSIYTQSLTPDDLSCFCWSILMSWTLAFLRRFNILLLAPVSRALWEATLSAE